MGINLPQFVVCDDCRETARVRACGRIEYDWPETTTGGQTATIPTLTAARLTVDCPNCGVKVQDYLADASETTHSTAAGRRKRLEAAHRQLARRKPR
jgi:hypothetical protein